MHACRIDRRRLSRALALAPTWTLARAGGATPLIVYLTPGLDLPFWRTLGRGVQAVVSARGQAFQVLDSRNSDALQLQNAQAAIAQGAAGLVLSPTSSASAVEVLDLASQARVPAVLADIGSNGGDYLSYIKSDNYRGAFGVGEVMAQAFRERGWLEAPYAMCTIALDRKNGQDRSNGFRDAMRAAGYPREVALRQMKSYTIEETHDFVRDMLGLFPKLRGLFIEVDKPTLGALQAVRERGRERGLLVCSFDGIPEFVELLQRKALLVVGMQQPYLMGQRAAEALLAGRSGSPPVKQILVPVLIAKGSNVEEWLSTAQKTVFGQVGH